nr:lipoprotein [Vibrio hippocampi]
MKFRVVHFSVPIAFLILGAIIGGIELIITINAMKKTISAFFILVAVTLSGCGQMGPLYLPDEAPPTNSQAQ